jgi:hypothetical protein
MKPVFVYYIHTTFLISHSVTIHTASYRKIPAEHHEKYWVFTESTNIHHKSLLQEKKQEPKQEKKVQLFVQGILLI